MVWGSKGLIYIFSVSMFFQHFVGFEGSHIYSQSLCFFSTLWGSEGLLQNTSSCSALLREEDVYLQSLCFFSTLWGSEGLIYIFTVSLFYSTVWGSEGLLENTSSCSALLREEDDHTSCHQTEYFPSEICPSVTASWTWCLFLIVSTPDILSCLYYLHKMTVKTPDEFPHVTFLAVSIMDFIFHYFPNK